MRSLVLFLLTALSLGAANLIPNSSFECGGGRGLFMVRSQGNESDFKVDALITTSEFQHGEKSFTLFAGYVIYVRPLYLEFLQTYKLSFYAKATASVTLHCNQATVTGVGSPTVNDVSVTTSWTRFSVDVIGAGGGGDHYLSWNHDANAETVYIDSIMLEPTSMSPSYEPMAQVECGITTSSPLSFNIMYTDSTKVFNLRFWNNGAEVENVVYYEIFDTWNRMVKAAFVTNTLPANNNFTNDVAFPASTNGYFRIVTRLPDATQGGNDSRDELAVAVLPATAQTLTYNTNAHFGIHSDTDWVAQRNALRPIGFTWTRTLSPFTATRWNTVEPTEGASFVFPNTAMLRFSTNGITPVLVLTSDDAAPPSWTTNAGGEIIEAKFIPGYSNYVYRMVTNYSAPAFGVRYFEFYNEPHTQCENGPVWFCDSNNVANLMIMTAKIVKDACPDCIFIGMGGMRDADFAKRVYQLMDGTQQGRIDIVSMHLYPKSESVDGNPMGTEVQSQPAAWKAEFGGIKPIWNTESGLYDWEGRLTDASPRPFGNTTTGWEEWNRSKETLETIQINPERVVQTAARCLGNGFKAYFYYDGRSWDQNMIYSLSAGGAHPSVWQATKSIRPKAVALQVLATFIDEATFPTPISHYLSSAIEMYYFQGAGSTKVIVAWCNDRGNRELTVTNDFTVYNLMGNQIAQTPGTIRLNRTPIYITTTVASSNTLAQTMRYGIAASKADTLGPNISVDFAPSGVWPGGLYRRIKWTAVDDTYINTTNGANYAWATNIDYAWKTNNGSYSIWSQTNYLPSITLPAGNSTLWVKARDAAGNITETAYSFSPMAEMDPPVTIGDGPRASRRGRTRQPLGGFP